MISVAFITGKAPRRRPTRHVSPALAAALAGLLAAAGPAATQDFDRFEEPAVAAPAPAAPVAAPRRRGINPRVRQAVPVAPTPPGAPATAAGGTPTPATPAAPAEPQLTAQQLRDKAVLERFADNLRRGRIAPDDNSPTDCVPIGLKETLNEVVQRFGSIVINSTYRSPSYNRYVGGARESFHLQCRAVDFTLVGRSQRNTQIMLRWLRARPGIGGIGIYDISGFVHIDDGPRRLWEQDEQWAATCRNLIGRDANRLVAEVVDPRARAAAMARREAEAREKAAREAAREAAAHPEANPDRAGRPQTTAAGTTTTGPTAGSSSPTAAAPQTPAQRRRTVAEERRAAMAAALEEATRTAPGRANSRRHATRIPAQPPAALRTAANLDVAARERVRSFRAVGRPDTPQECMLFLVAEAEADQPVRSQRRHAAAPRARAASARRSGPRSGRR